MADVFAELDEVMRQERMERFWKENKNTLITCVIATIILTAAISGYRSWNTHVQTTQTDKLIEALDSQKPADGLLAISDDLRPGLRGIALLNAGRALLADGKRDEAIKAYQQAAEDRMIPSDLRDLAVLMDVQLSPQTAENKDALLKKLEGVYSDSKSPWQYHARLEAASILAHTGNDYTAALEQLKIISDAENLPPSLKAKALALTQVYALEAPAKAPAETPAKDQTP